MPKAALKVGSSGEDNALNYLEQHGLRLIVRNFHSRFGEIDLIMQDQDTTVFIEVKKRDTGINNALESITYSKQQKLIKTANYYLSKTSLNLNCRFDAIAIDRENNITWLKNVILL